MELPCDILDSYKFLSTEGKIKAADNLACICLANGNSKAVIISLARTGHWDILGTLLLRDKIRESFSEVIGVVEWFAIKHGHIHSFDEILPSLNHSESLHSFEIPIKSLNIEITRAVIRHGGVPSHDEFICLLDSITNSNCDYSKSTIKYLIECTEYNWRKPLGFASYADWRDVLKRARETSASSYYFLIECIISKKDRAQFYNAIESEAELLLVSNLIEIPGHLINKLSYKFKAALLRKDLGC